MEASVDNCIHGFHMYQDAWVPLIDKVLKVKIYFNDTLGIQVYIQNSNSDSVMCEGAPVLSSSAVTSLDTSIKSPLPEKCTLDSYCFCRMFIGKMYVAIKCVTVDNSESNIIVNTEGV